MINTNPFPRSTADRRAPLALWAMARACLRTLYALFGAPRDVAAAGWLSRRRIKLLRAWLRAAHAVIVRLLLIEAAALPAPTPTRSRTERRMPRARRFIEHHADAPERWRVALRLSYRRLPAGSGANPCRPEADGVFATKRDPLDAWPLAERYEALRRACADPAPYVQRLRRRLAAAPGRAGELLARARLNAELIGAEAVAALTPAAAGAVDIIAAAASIRAPPGSARP